MTNCASHYMCEVLTFRHLKHVVYLKILIFSWGTIFSILKLRLEISRFWKPIYLLCHAIPLSVEFLHCSRTTVVRTTVLKRHFRAWRRKYVKNYLRHLGQISHKLRSVPRFSN